ncbi:MAG: hypothetical protein P4M01_05480 [Acidobacteriota bacterium]|nr:hypothetical protein [Acidobacteriota bacterium]
MSEGIEQVQSAPEPHQVIQQRIASEPGDRASLLKILALCQVPRPTAEVYTTVQGYAEMAVSIHTPQILVCWLLECGALRPIGEPGENEMLETTEAGRCEVESQNCGQLLRQLLEREPEYRREFLEVLELCVSPRTRSEVEDALESHAPADRPPVLVSFYLDALEHAGGIEWNHKWQTTEVAKHLLREMQTDSNPFIDGGNCDQSTRA